MNTGWIRGASMGVMLVLLSGCYTGRQERAADAAPTAEAQHGESVKKSDQEDPAAKKRLLMGRMDIARSKLRQAELEQASSKNSSNAALHRAKVELELAQAHLRQFVELESPNRLERAKLNLVRAKDRAREAADELAQIEIMYEETDLQDRTAEFVVARGRRNAERQAAMIKLEEQSLLSLEQHTLPQELKMLELDVRRKQDDLADSESKLESTSIGKEIGVMSAQQELEKLSQELTKLGGKEGK